MKEIEKENLVEELKKLKEKGMRLISISAFDSNLVYHLGGKGKVLNLKTEAKDKGIESATEVFENAAFYERQVYEKRDIKFKGHPNLKKLFTE